jgi:protein deglycase
MKKKILLILADGFEDIEAVSAIDVLNRASVEVTIAGLSDGPVKGAYGTTIITHETIDDIKDDYDGIVLPGGRKNAEALAANKKVIELIRSYNSTGKLIGAICASPSHVLSEAAGILKGIPATGDPIFNEKLARGGALITNEAVTISGHIITGIGPGAALEFALALGEYLTGSNIVDELATKWRITHKMLTS